MAGNSLQDLSLRTRIGRRLILADPGLLNSRRALQGTVAVTLTFWLTALMAHRLGQPFRLTLLSSLITILIAIAVVDPTRKQQMITVATLWVPISIALLTSIALKDSLWLHTIAFMAIAFVAVYFRRYGPRWSAYGKLAFIAYFTTLVYPVANPYIPAVLGAVFIAVSVSFASRFYFLNADPGRQLRLYLISFETRYSSALCEIVRALRTSKRTLHRAETEYAKLNELSLTIEQFTSSYSLKTASEKLQVELFERELVLRRLMNHTRILKESSYRDEALRSAGEIEGWLNGKAPSATKPLSEIESLLLKAQTQSDLFTNDEQLAKVAKEVERRTESTASLKKATAQNAPFGLHESTRQAIQATLATGLASTVGATLSPDRWYWASIAAFMVFVGTSRGETLTRASLRTMGTVAGLVSGFLLAYVLSGNRPLEWISIIIAVFFAIFAARVAFGFWTAMLFTFMIAILFDLVGELDFMILMLRLEETIVGAFAGALIGSFVLPTSTHTIIRGSLARFLRTGSLALGEVPESSQPFQRRAAIKRLRELERDLIALRASAAPVTAKGSLMKSAEIIGAIHDASALCSFMHHLVIEVEPSQYLGDARRLSEIMVKLADDIEKAEDVESHELQIKSEMASAQWLEDVEDALLSLSRRRI